MAFNPEDVTLWAGLAASLAATLAAFFHVRGQGYDHYRRAERLAWATTAFYGLALLVLLHGFVTLRVGLDYVHRHTDAATPLVYRVAGLWAGQEGTLLMWITFAAAVLALNARLWRRRVDEGRAAPPGPDHPLPWTLLFGFAVVALLGVASLLAGTFARTDASALAARPAGRGLQPVLETPFMVLHPPLQFLGYGIIVFLFAAAMAHLATGRRDWADVALPWARLALLVVWTGLGIGALWAYYVLNFGGYWAWDPVETANLLVFLPLVPLVHALIYYRKKGTFAAMAPLFALLAFFATLFSALATRTGLWVSIHAFTDPTQAFNPDPLGRLLAILRQEPITSHFAGVLVVTGAAALAAYLWRLSHQRAPTPSRLRHAWTPAYFALGGLAVLGALDAPEALALLFEAARLLWPPNAALGLGFLLALLVVLLSLPTLVTREEAPRERPRGLEHRLSMANLVYLGMLVVAAGLLIVFLIDVVTVNGYDRAHYDRVAPLVGVPLLLVLGTGFANKFLGARTTLALAAGALALGLLLVWTQPGPWPILLGAPAFVFALVATGLKLFKVSDPGPQAPAARRWIGGLLLFGGVAALAYWANPPSRIPFPLAPLEVHPWAAALGLPLGAAALLAGAVTLAEGHHRVAQAGSLALAATLAWLVALPLGLGLWAASRRLGGALPTGQDAWHLGATLRSARRSLRKTGVYLIHVAVVLGLGGYAASAYLGTEEATLELEPGRAAAAHGYTFLLASSGTEGVAAATQTAQEIHAHVLVTRGSTVVANTTLVAWQELRYHYAERVSVQRLPLHDVYLHPRSLTVATLGGSTTFEPHQDGVLVFPGATVEAVRLTATVIPGMHLVWAGVWMLSLGVLLAFLFGGYDTSPATRPRREKG